MRGGITPIVRRDLYGQPASESSHAGKSRDGANVLIAHLHALLPRVTFSTFHKINQVLRLRHFYRVK